MAALGISEELSTLHSRVLDTLSEAFVCSEMGSVYEWCRNVHIDPAACSVLDVLRFLQYRMDSGTLSSTLEVYVAAIALFRSPLGMAI